MIYFAYPTSSNLAPSNTLVSPDPGNNANFVQNWMHTNGVVRTTLVGAFENSDSPYGTFDQGGNVWEWNDTNFGLRGGAYHGWNRDDTDNLWAGRSYSFQTLSPGDIDNAWMGFRVASAPVPGDANNDGYVDDKDASILGAHWMSTVADWSMGDFNQDGNVNDKDAAILAAHWGQTAEGMAADVPEPSTLVLLGIGALGIATSLWRKRKAA